MPRTFLLHTRQRVVLGFPATGAGELLGCGNAATSGAATAVVTIAGAAAVAAAELVLARDGLGEVVAGWGTGAVEVSATATLALACAASSLWRASLEHLEHIPPAPLFLREQSGPHEQLGTCGDKEVT
jgi:hypothetical protein